MKRGIWVVGFYEDDGFRMFLWSREFIRERYIQSKYLHLRCDMVKADGMVEMAFLVY